MGCPVGIGPEVILKFFATAGNMTEATAVVLGDTGVLARCARELALDVEIVPWRAEEPLPVPRPGRVPVLALSQLPAASLEWGKPSAATGRAMAGYIEAAVRLTQQGRLSALVTAPIAKSALRLAGYSFPGHTEMLADLCDAPDYGMMMAGGRLRVVLATIHVPLAAVPASLSRSDLVRVIRLAGRSLQKDFGISSPRIAVAGLNPHAGEGGIFGVEEQVVIGPAIEEAAAAGWVLSGPWPPDTVFHRAATGEFDAVVCMYHDQGLIPFKLLHFEDGVNVTLGLPLVRTSVDHGTAYDIAGRGLARPTSLAAAFAMAVAIARNRNSRQGAE
ncbi:MAG: 4-hydroxythreonine-4-phosphate dehydrogenase PdxA [Deltaproteobacteria bacterium RIFOXYD12_FULL_57_12]|nr:MAG: 4-hydroxythreonine-4-phosphate dehydrogenase PdxA [Deltaproteobacteria bacterium RIFOXYD12_FULL_57_12]